MATTRKINEFYTESKRVIADEVVQVTCCCVAPTASRAGCMMVAGNKTPCRCACHAAPSPAPAAAGE